MNCVICDSTERIVVDTMTFFLNDKIIPSTEVVACARCGYVWLSPPIPKEELDAYYRTQDRMPTESRAYKEQLAFIAKFVKLPDTKRVLDIGAYDGRLLDLFGKAGVKYTYSVEPDLENTDTKFISLADAARILEKNSVNLITMGHVFEHVQQPVEVLAQCKELLVPGGALFIEVPDLVDPQVQVVPYWTPFHHSYFTLSTLMCMLERAGFVVKAVEITGYRAVRVIARAFNTPQPTQGDVPPSHDSFQGIENYHAERTRLFNGLRDRLSWLEHENLAIFGAGDHTHWLLRFFPDLRKNTFCILDSNPNKIGTEFEGLPVEHPDDCPVDVDRIIISSYDTQDVMATQVGKRAMLLYEDVRAYDVWLGEDDAII